MASGRWSQHACSSMADGSSALTFTSYYTVICWHVCSCLKDSISALTFVCNNVTTMLQFNLLQV
jgi:hypothetical protein